MSEFMEAVETLAKVQVTPTVNVEQIIEQWIQQHLYNSPVSRSANVIEFIRSKIPALVTMLTSTNSTTNKA